LKKVCTELLAETDARMSLLNIHGYGTQLLRHSTEKALSTMHLCRRAMLAESAVGQKALLWDAFCPHGQWTQVLGPYILPVFTGRDDVPCSQAVWTSTHEHSPRTRVVCTRP